MTNASPSVPTDADAADLGPPPVGDAGDASVMDETGADDAGLASPEGAAVVAPPPAAPSEIAAEDLAPALDAAGIEHDMAPSGIGGESETGEAVATGEAARSGKGLAIALGVVRLGVGAALVAAPRWAGRIWVGPGADGPGSLVFARALGARDVALGLRILDGVRKGEPVRHWVTAGFAADLADVAATVIAGRHLTPARRIAMPLVAGAVGAAGAASLRSTQRS